jgi:hypothetical protein
MSLWFQGLSWAIEGAETPEKKAGEILAHLSMSVPRSWWEKALVTSDAKSHSSILRPHAALLNDLRSILIKFLDSRESIDSGLLIALAFTDMEAVRYGPDKGKSGTEIQDYLTKARKVLEERPDIVELGTRVDEIVKQKKAPSGD